MDLALQNSYYIDNNHFSTDSDGSSDTATNSSMNSHILSKKKTNKYKKINKNINNKLNNINDEHDNDDKKQNIILKLINRERTGYFSNSPSKKCKQFAYKKVPTRLSFCLKEIIPFCQYMQGHVFMGLSACGQFLLSYKVSYDEEISNNNYNFSTSQKYELYFWIYRPHMLLVKYYNVCLFDDHGVHNLITVTMSQWMTDPRTLIVHGTNEFDNEDSYLTIVSVPKLGCLDCKALRDEYSDEYLRCDSLCIKCNLTIHTKYSSTESDPKFNPKINLNCPGRIIMISNGFIHMLHVQLDLNKVIKSGSSSFKLSNNDVDKRNINLMTGLVNGCFGIQSPLTTTTATPTTMTVTTSSTSNTINNCLQSDDKVNTVLIDDLFSINKVHIIDNINQIKFVTRSSHSEHHHDKKYTNISSTITNDSQNIKQTDNCSIVDRIIADFAECETDNYGHEKIFRYPPRIDRATAINTTKNFDELVITCSGSNNSNSICDDTGDLPSSSNPSTKSLYNNNIQLLKHHNQDSLKGDKVISKSLRTTRNCITTIDLSGNVNNETIPPSTSANSNLDIAAKTYEFSEDNEKCEKISTFRKRRLADKKYEFDEEDNSENIIPFNRLRTMYKNFPFHTKASRPTSMSPNRNFTNSNNTNPNNLYTASSPNYDLTNHLHRASPSHGFRSPCGSPVGNRCLRSPPGSLNRSSCLYSGRSHTYATMKSSISPRQIIKKTPATDILLNDQQQTELLINKSPQPQPTQSPKRTISDDILPILNQSTNNSNGNSNTNTAKPVCTKRFVRRFVEEDDATSVITSEEDDCISPGYHTSLPMEVHGACYSDMQMISQASYYKLKNCPTVTITQNSFDLETFTFYIANHLCTIHNKKYGVFYDWACELVQVCPLSNILTCILMIHFTAREHLLLNEKSCMNCANNLDCVLHRKHYQCSTLFTWDTDTGIWNVLDYGLLVEVQSGNAPFSSNVKVKRNPIKVLLKNNNLINAGRQLHDKIKNVANYLTTSYDFNYKFLNNLRVLDSCHEKSKNILHDLHNSIEFYRSHNNDMDSSTSNQDDSSDLSYFLPSDIDD